MWGLEITLNNNYDQVIKNIDGMKSLKGGSGKIEGGSGSSEEMKPTLSRPRHAGKVSS